MKKKVFVLVFALLIAVFFFWPRDKQIDPNGDCPFCDPAVLELQAFYADDLVLALYDHRPVTPGHCLVIPRRHVPRFHELSDPEADQICRVLKKVHLAVSDVFGTDPYLLLEKNGWEAGQSVFHVHFHYIPRKTGEGSWCKLLLSSVWTHIGKPMGPAKTKEVIDQLKEAMDSRLTDRGGEELFELDQVFDEVADSL